MWKRLLLLAALFLSLLTIAACDLEFPEQEIHFRHDAQADRLDVLFIAKGLSAETLEPKSVQKGVNAVQRLLAGRREFMVIDWPWYVDYEDLVEKARKLEVKMRSVADELPDDKRAELVEARHLLGVADLVKVTKVGLYEDPEGRLCGYQLAQIHELSRFLDWLNGLISRHILAEDAPRELANDRDLDEETVERWVAKARVGTPWVTFQDGAMVVDVPLSEDLLSTWLAEVFEEILDADEEDRWMILVFSELLRHTRTANLGDQGLEVVVGHSSGTTVMTPVHPERTYSPALAKALAAMGVGPEEDLTIEQIRHFLPGSETQETGH
jgi:hypothetical protein